VKANVKANMVDVKRQGSIKALFSYPEVSVIIPLVIMVIVIGTINPVFFKVSNLVAILRGLSFYAIVAIGQALVIIGGEIDISLGSMAALGAMMCCKFMTIGIPVVLSIVLGLAICAIIGFINGILVTRLKISSFIVTIGMHYAASGLALMITDRGYPIYPLPDIFNQMGNAQPLGLSWAFLCAMALILVFNFILRKTIFGRKLYAVGDNSETARLAGIHVENMKTATFMISATLAGLAGLLLAAQMNTGNPTIGTGWEMQAVAACAVGGVSLSGGVGSMTGTLLGALVMQVLYNGIVILRIDAQVQTIMIGVIMISAVIVDLVRRKKKMGL
jgi:ribose transport system permease protein